MIRGCAVTDPAVFDRPESVRAAWRDLRVPSEKLVRLVVIEDYPDLSQAVSTMIPALLAVLASFRSLFRSRAALQAEVFALRHQLLILERQRGGRRVPLPDT